MNTLIYGDALKELAKLPTASIDAIVTDPPYCSGGQNAGDRSRLPSEKYMQSGQLKQWPDFDGDCMDGRAYASWCYLWLTECHRIAKDGGLVLIFTDWRQMGTIIDQVQHAGFIRRGCAVWDKGGGCRPHKGRFAHQAEYIIWGSKGRLPMDRGVGTLPGVFKHVVEPVNKKLHMTGKPIGLMEDLLQIVAPGGAVLDPFAGSGSTLVAAHKRGLSWTGIEKSPEYYEVARKRLAGGCQAFGG